MLFSKGLCSRMKQIFKTETRLETKAAVNFAVEHKSI